MVSEISNIQTTLSQDKYKIFLLEKKGYSTSDAIASLSSYLSIDQAEVGYAGLKDEDGITKQKISIPSNLINVAQQLTKFFSEEGPMNIQVILSVADGKPYIIDIHCRIGGGSELSIEGGVPLHEWIIDDIIGGEKEYNMLLMKD